MSQIRETSLHMKNLRGKNYDFISKKCHMYVAFQNSVEPRCQYSLRMGISDKDEVGKDEVNRLQKLQSRAAQTISNSWNIAS